MLFTVPMVISNTLQANKENTDTAIKGVWKYYNRRGLGSIGQQLSFIGVANYHENTDIDKLLYNV